MNSSLKPGQIRQRILQEHAALRAKMARLEAELDKLDGQEANLARVAEFAGELLVDLAAHTQLEDTLLSPLLRERDASGPLRADMLLQHHGEQRENMRQLMAAYRNHRDLARIVRMTTQLLVEVRADMLHEESSLLRSDRLFGETQTSEPC